MLQLLHRYRIFVLWAVVLSGGVLIFEGMGLGTSSQQGQTSYALKINDEEVTHSELGRTRRRIQEQYRRMFGAQYEQFAAQIESNINQQAVDQILSDQLLIQDATSKGFRAPADAVKQILVTELFPEGFDKDLYVNLLRQQGLTPQKFEEDLRLQAQRSQLVSLLQDASVISKYEARASLIRQGTTYSLGYAIVDPAKLESEVSLPGDDVLKEHLTTHAFEFEVPPAVSYRYVLLTPDLFTAQVQVLPEDVETYYSKNERDFRTPPEVRARHIQLNFKPNSSFADRTELKKKAEVLLERLQKGETFDALALEASDDFMTKTVGGDLGWIAPGKFSREFDAAVFDVEAGQLSPVIEAEYGFHIVQVEALKPAASIPLESVRAQIEKTLREEEAPLYAAEISRDYFDEWRSSSSSLEDFATAKKLSVSSTTGLLSEKDDPEPAVASLTKRVLTFPEELKQLVEVGNTLVLVEIKEHKPLYLPALAEIKAQVTKHYTSRQAITAAQKKAEELALAASTSDSSLETLAQSQKIPFESKSEIDVAKSDLEVLRDADARGFIVATTTTPRTLASPVEEGGTYFVLTVTKVTTPELKADSEKKIEELVERGASEAGSSLLASYINTLKAASTYDVDPSVLTDPAFEE